MQWIDFAILVVTIGIVLCVIRYHVIKKKMGDAGGCGGGCSHCPMGDQCHKNEKK